MVVSFGYIMLEVLDEAREKQKKRLERDDLEKQKSWEAGHDNKLSIGILRVDDERC